jgi:hypothetical protein
MASRIGRDTGSHFCQNQLKRFLIREWREFPPMVFDFVNSRLIRGIRG